MNKASFIGKYNNQIINIPFSVGFSLQSPGQSPGGPICTLSEEEKSIFNKIKSFFEKEDIILVDTAFGNTHAYMGGINPTFNVCFIFLKKFLLMIKL